MVRPVLVIVERLIGRKKLETIISDLGVNIEYFEQKHNWISMSFTDDLWKALEHEGVDINQLMYQAGLNSMSRQELGIAYYIFSQFPTFSALLKVVTSVSVRLNKVVTPRYIVKGRNEGLIELTDLRPRQDLHSSRCESWRGTIEGASKFYLGEENPASIKEVACVFRGDDLCRFSIKWSPRAASFKRLLIVTGLIAVLFNHSVVADWMLALTFDALILTLSVAAMLMRKTAVQDQRIADMRREFAGSSQVLENNFREFHRERELNLKQQIEANNQFIEKLKRVAASVAHEVNNPLAIILGNASLIAMEVDAKNEVIDRQKIEKNIARINEAGARTKAISSALYLYSGLKKEGHGQTVGLHIFEATLRKLVADSNRLCDVVNTSDVSLVAANYVIDVSEDDLTVVLSELVKNAFYAVAQKSEDTRLLLSIQFAVRADEVLFRLSDNGPGFTEEALQKGLDLFFTTKRLGEGKGLGLNMIEGIVRNAGGSVSLHNNQQGGATVQLGFPRRLILRE